MVFACGPGEKEDGTTRYYCRLNSVTKPNIYPLSRLNDSSDRLYRVLFFTMLDLLSGYWQVELDPEDSEKSTFITPNSIYQSNRLPFALCNAPATFQMLIDCVLVEHDTGVLR